MMCHSQPEKGTIILRCAMSNLLACGMHSMIYAFFQMYAAQTCGASEAAVGLIVVAFPFGTCLASFPVRKMTTKFGCSFCLITGLLLLAVSAVAFGVSRTIASCLCLRVVQGMATAAIFSSTGQQTSQTPQTFHMSMLYLRWCSPPGSQWHPFLALCSLKGVASCYPSLWLHC
mmetsp:Transcript_115081/g.223577  ORF Transcript_115081/g.223577 Transcript_115081/m.223577 type:complete len:173 (+) Transcript_115081:58-576(+)